MSEKVVRRKKKKEEKDEGKPSDEETAIAKYLRFNLTTKSCNFLGNKVEYFTGSKAVDFLMDSKWASGAKGTPAIFTDRKSVSSYLDILLQKGFYMRALKVAVKKKDKESKETEGKKKTKKSEKEKESVQEGGEKKEKKEKEKSRVEDSGDKKQKEGKRKIKLEGTNEQIFVDGNDAYVWIFDPIKPLHYVYGLGLVIGAIAVCLFPLWPPWMRVGTYYMSIGGACLVGSIVVLAIVRTIIYGIIWAVTFGKVSWWLFPNLLADVGILESFQPVYACEYSTGEGEKEGSGDQDKDNKNEANEESDNGEVATEETQKRTIENVGVNKENIEGQDKILEDRPSEVGPSEDVLSEDRPSEDVQETENDPEQNGSNNEDENISQTSEKSETSSSQGSKDFEVVRREDVVDADDLHPDDV